MKTVGCMTAEERYNDIAEKCGQSVDIVRAVLRAVQKSAIESIRKGQRVTLPGVVKFNVRETSRLGIGGGVRKMFVLKAEPSASISKAVNEEEYKYDIVDVPDGLLSDSLSNFE